MKKFDIKKFAKWHKKKYGPGIFESDIIEYYNKKLHKSVKVTNDRYESIVLRTMEINNY